MTIEQEPKYEIKEGKIVNRATGEAIPDDEPIFIMRARDCHASRAIRDYAVQCENDKHTRIVMQRYGQFKEWAALNPERMHEPTSPD